MDQIKVLILTANPSNTEQAPLKLDAEVREIEEALRRSQFRDYFEVETAPALRPQDLQRELLDHRPQIVHFSGHGTKTRGLVLEDDAGEMKFVSTDALEMLFGALTKNPIQCVLFNACHSEEQAYAIHRFVDCVIGMKQAINDQVAIDFAVRFYDALGAGSSYGEAFDNGCAAIALEGSSQFSIPQLIGGRQGRAISPIEQDVSAVETTTPAQAPPTPTPSQSQLSGNITISGSGIAFNMVQAGNDAVVNQSQTQTQLTNPDLQVALEALANLKQAIATTDAINDTQKKMVSVPIQGLEEELQKPRPDRSAVEQSIEALKMFLGGVTTLAEPVTQVATLVVKVLGG